MYSVWDGSSTIRVYAYWLIHDAVAESIFGIMLTFIITSAYSSHVISPLTWNLVAHDATAVRHSRILTIHAVGGLEL